jgi:hypothetical protein
MKNLLFSVFRFFLDQPAPVLRHRNQSMQIGTPHEPRSCPGGPRFPHFTLNRIALRRSQAARSSASPRTRVSARVVAPVSRPAVVRASRPAHAKGPPPARELAPRRGPRRAAFIRGYGLIPAYSFTPSLFSLYSLFSLLHSFHFFTLFTSSLFSLLHPFHFFTLFTSSLSNQYL